MTIASEFQLIWDILEGETVKVSACYLLINYC